MPTAFTLCSNNYLAKAEIAAETFRLKHPNYKFYIFLVDEFIAGIHYEKLQNVTLVSIKDVVPDIEELARRYNIIELNTAVKPAVFTFLFNTFGTDYILYLDPDLMTFAPFIEVEELILKKNYNIIVTPHFCSPIDDGKIPSEIDLSVYGLYNLGFIAIKNSVESFKFLHWWHERLMKYCYIDPAKGMFTDQLWVNHAPIFYEGVYILKHLGYNVANWNLYERKIEKINDAYYVNRIEKLKFFHFSHYKFNDPYLISDKQNRHSIEEFEDLRVIIDEYQLKLIHNNHESLSKIHCYYQLMYDANQQVMYEAYQHDLRNNKPGVRSILRRAKNKTIRVAKKIILNSK